ncbi:MAG: histidinol-phosphate transaminase [Bacillota bacterium]|nr:histidinol-phosphate transaminase [Bacillota bacterium]
MTSETNPFQDNSSDRQSAPGACRFWNKKTAGLIPYVPGEQPRDRAFIKLNTNENPYEPTPEVRAALSSFAAEQLRLYPDPASTSLRQAIADYSGLSPEQVFAGNGSDEVLALAFQAFFEPVQAVPAGPDRAVTFPDVTYSFYPVYARFYEINWRTIPLADDFSLPVASFQAPSGGIVLANPNAPTGMAVGIDVIEHLAAADRDRLVIVDEAYVDFGAETAIPLLADYDNLLIVQTCSKSRALAGIRLGYALGAPELIDALQRVRDSFNSYTLDRLAQTIGQAAFGASAWFEQMRSRIIRSRERMAAALSERQFQVLPSSANFVFARHAALSGRSLYQGLRDQGILVRHFNLPRIDDFLRITVGTDGQIDELIRVLDRLLI